MPKSVLRYIAIWKTHIAIYIALQVSQLSSAIFQTLKLKVAVGLICNMNAYAQILTVKHY